MLDNRGLGVAETVLKRFYGPKLKAASARWPRPYRSRVRAVMGTPPTQTTALTSQVTSSIRWASASGTTFFNVVNPSSESFTYLRGSPKVAVTGDYVTFDNVTTTLAPAYGAASTGVAFYHQGQDVEIILGGTAGTYFMVKVDDEYTSLTPTAVTSNSAENYYRLSFAARAHRRIEVIGYNLSFAGVMTGPNDSITPAPVRGPRTVILGDSFVAGSGASGVATNNFVVSFADEMGWDDVWASGVGGTGYLATNTGTAPTFRGRAARDVIAYAPEVVIVVGLQNDWGASTAAQLGAEAALLAAQLKSALPNAVIAAAPNFNKGVNGVTATHLDIKDAVKAAWTAAGCLWLDLIELPLSTTPLSGAITGGAVSAGLTGATGLKLNFVPQPQSTVEIGSGATRERIQLKSFSQTGGSQYTALFDGALQYAHANGEAVTQVGGSLWTGTGKVGTTTGYGNADLYVSADGTHPTDAGHLAMGATLAQRLITSLAPN